MQKKNNIATSKGFTLSEVLITLTVIGLVGAYCIPSIVREVSHNMSKSHFKEIYQNVGYALRQMTFKGIKIRTAEDAARYCTHPALCALDNIVPYFDVTKECRGNSIAQGCMSEDYEIAYLQPYEYGPDPIAMHNSEFENAYRGMVVLRGGEYLMFTHHHLYTDYLDDGNYYTLDAANSKILVDINGEKGPNMYGRDVFGIRVIDPKRDGRLAIQPFGSSDDVGQRQGNCSTTKARYNNGASCAFYVIMDKDY